MKLSSGQVFEVRCPGCGVSFPPGTKSCLHCGSRIPRGRVQASLDVVARNLVPAGTGAEEDAAPRRDPDLPAWLDRDRTPDEKAEVERPRWLRWGTNIVWVAIAIAATLSQMCGRG